MKVLYLTFLVVIIDQVTKFLVKGIKVEWLGIELQGMSYGSSKKVIGDYLRITFIENPGMAFGIDIGPKMLLTLFTIFASLVILFYIYRHRNDGLLMRLSLGFILAGAFGNLIDRTFYGEIYGYAPYFHGKVVDFIQIEFWDFTFLGKTYTTWPIFNVADISVTIGFLIILFFHKRVFKLPEEKSEIASTDAVEEAANTELPTIQSGLRTNNSDSTLIQQSYVEDRKENPDKNSSRAEESQN